MEASALHAGIVVDRWTVEAPIGEGGMATVWRVRHNKLGTLHALKVLSVGNAEIKERMRQEGELQAQLQHPNIVAVTDVIELHGSPGLVMEYVDGPSLDGLLGRHRLTVEQADELARGILAGVAAAHRRGLVHRDLKPANILLKVTEQGFMAKVADFGLAKIATGGGHARTRTGSTMGTPHYMSPEQIRDSKNVGPRSDIFALGAILYEMVTGYRAFDGSDLLEIFNAVASGRYKPPREHVPDLPERMERAIVAALQVDQEQRPATVEALDSLWSGRDALTTSKSAFDTGTLQLARTLAAGFAEPPKADDRQTWAGAVPTISDSSVGATDLPTGSLEPQRRPEAQPPEPAVDSLSTRRAAFAIGLGGTALAVIGLLALGGIGLAGVGAWYAFGTGPVAEAPAEVNVDPAPAAVAPAPVVPEPPVIEAPAAPSPADAAWGPAVTVKAAPAPVPRAPVPVATPAAPGPQVAPDTAPVEPDPAVAVVEPVPEPVPTPAPVAAPVAEPEPTGPELTPLLADPDPAERKKGVANLGKREDAEAIELLGWVVEHDKDAGVRRAAWQTTVSRYEAGFGDRERLQRIVVWQMGHGSERDALEAVQVFGREGRSPALLKAGLGHWSPLVRVGAIEAALLVAPRAPAGTAWRDLLGPLTTDADPAVAKKATAALAKLD